MNCISHRIWFSLILLVAGVVQGLSQDIHFSQVNAVNMLVNPAFISSNANLEATVISREQWPVIGSKTYRTSGGSVEARLRTSDWKELDNQKFTFRKASSSRAIGLCMYHDNAGNGSLSTDVAYLGFNQEFKLTKKHRLSFGLQAGANYLKTGSQNLSYPNQYNSSGFYDPSLSSNEVYQNSQMLLFDCAAGINYTIKEPGTNFLPEKNRLVIGFSAFHLNRARYTFIQNERLNPRYNLNVTYLFERESSNISISPVLYASFEGKQKNILAGALFHYRLSDDSKYTGLKQAAYISLGCLYRNADAFCFPVKLDIRNYSVGFNYDLNVSSLARSSKAVGAFEICLSFHSVTPYLYQKKTNP